MAMSSAENVAGSVTCVAAILRMQHVLFCGICVTPPLCAYTSAETAIHRSLEPKSGVEHSGNNSGGEPPGSETIDRCPRMCKRVFVLRQASPIFAPQLSCKSSL